MAVGTLSPAVEEYWLVLVKSRTVECFSDPQSGVYGQVRRFAEGEAVKSLTLPGGMVELGRVFR